MARFVAGIGALAGGVAAGGAVMAQDALDGLETIGHIIKLRFELPVIIFSAYSSYKNDSMAMAADAYVVKSSDFSELKKKVHELGNHEQ